MESIRKVRHKESDMVLEVFDTFKTDNMGKSRLAYDFRKSGDEKPLFSGDDFFCGRFTAIDSDDCLVSLLGFLTLRPGDTDREYFDNYTEEQITWSNSSEYENFSCDLAILGEEDSFEQIFEEI
jgi:hypothetical protein